MGRFSSANQYIFKVTTRPANKANQLKFSISRGAAAIIAMLTANLTDSHTKKPKPAVAAFSDENWLIRPRANNAAGMMTANAPYAADQATEALPETPQATKATTNPTTHCNPITHQGDNAGSRSRKACASCEVSRLKS